MKPEESNGEPPAPSRRHPWHAMETAEVAQALDTDPAEGLADREVRRRLRRHGPNRLREAKPVPWWRVLAYQFKSLVVLLLVAAALISFGLGENLEGFSIVVVILLNAGLGFVTEFRAARAMEALQKLGAQEALVLRGGKRRSLPATDVVPGDVLLLAEGEAVPADARVLESAELRLDEAALTGESLPVTKTVAALEDPELPLADRTNMVFKATNVVSGNGRAVVVGTGMDTQIGRVSELVSETEDVETPLEKRLARMGRRLIVLCLGVAAAVAVAGIVQGEELGMMLKAGIALAVAAVPEGLPAVATITLAVGMKRMARKNALIRRLPAVETLGSATCVCTDKTGTLTRNEMTVSRLWVWDRDVAVSGGGYEPTGTFQLDGREIDPGSDPALRGLLMVGALCNNAGLVRTEDGEWDIAGDPTEGALVVAARKAGLEAEELRRRHAEVKEFPFSSNAMMMGTVNDGLDAALEPGDGRVLSVKGSPTVVADHCTHLLGDGEVRELTEADRARIEEINEAMAGEGLRVIGFACRSLQEVPEEPEDAYRELVWLGLAGMVDPPREEVRQTVDVLTRAGIDTVMITGDQPATAANIAADLHIAPQDAPVLTGRDLSALGQPELAAKVEHVEVFARVSPEQKVDILTALQRNGDICAMLGDGVNDAVALKQADIGVAMGIKGTDVAKETADMLLLDDRFVTVGAAVQQGRVIYANIKKFIHYLFSCNLSEILTMLGASLLGQPLPLLPLQILWLNMVTDVFPALALAMEPGERDIMERSPRPPGASLLDPGTVRSIVGFGLLITFSTLMAFVYGRFVRGYPTAPQGDRAVTMAFMTIALAQLFHVFNSRKERGPVRGRQWLGNPYVLGAIVVTVALQLAAVYLPPLQKVLKTVPPTGGDWMVIVLYALAPLAVGQLWSWRKGYDEPSGGTEAPGGG